MSRPKQNDFEDRVEKNFQDVKRRSEIKERYGVFTQKMFEQLLEELRLRIRDDTKFDYNKLNEKLDWLIGAYKKFDEEHTLLSNKVSSIEDRLNTTEGKLKIAN